MYTFLLFLKYTAVKLEADILSTECGMKREKTIENLQELAELTQQVQADRIEIVLEERSDNY
ncbi:hypothetical protein AKH09_24365, partial [Vibrio parahaemolyticus]